MEKILNFWQDVVNIVNYVNFSTGTSEDIIFNQKIAIEAVIKYKMVNLNYTSHKMYATKPVHINFPIIQIPVLFKCSIPIRKTVSTVSAITFAGGINSSFVVGKQNYADSLSRDIGNFSSPKFDIGMTVEAIYSYKIGLDCLFLGIKADINILQQKYKISGHGFNIGNIVTVSPVLGYTFILREDKELEKINEKNKHIKDIDVK